jgi:hypothetical protein
VRKKKLFCLFLVFCDAGRCVLWWFCLVCGGWRVMWWSAELQRPSEEKKKKKKGCRRNFGLLKSYFVALYYFCCCCFCGGRRFLSSPACSNGLRRCSGESPAKVRRASSGCFCSVFSVFLLFLGIVGMFCVFPASFEAPTKFCIFRRCSGEVSSSCFPANLVG